jgi:hypothetical protein
MVVNILSRVRDALAGARDDLDKIRDEIWEIQGEIRQIENLPFDRTTIELHVDAEIEAARRFPDNLRDHLGKRNGFNFRHYFNGVTSNDPFTVAAWLQPDALRKHLLEHAPEGGISDQERTAKLVDLRDKLQAAEMAEEATIRQIEAASGSHLPRRDDADPAILLAPDCELG